MAKPAKTVFMDMVETALKTVIESNHDVQRRPTVPTDRDNFKAPFIRFAYFASRKRRDNRVQFVEFDLQVETSIERTGMDSVDVVGEALQADIEIKLLALMGTKPCVKIECTGDDILYYDDEFRAGMAVSTYAVMIAYNYGNPYSY
jgi:hypothetical protein